MQRLPYAVIELAMVALFLVSLRDAGRKGRRALLELLSAVPFGLLLEQGDIMIFGSYAYNQAFFLKIGLVPIAIALAWAMIIRSCMAISDAAGVPARLAPFSDALLAILLDLSFDTIAIRQGLWHWQIRLDQGFFGVPAGNYYAWLFVALGFSAWTRLIRRWARTRPRLGWLQLIVPLPAYATLLAGLVPFIALEGIVFSGPGGGFPVFERLRFPICWHAAIVAVSSAESRFAQFRFNSEGLTRLETRPRPAAGYGRCAECTRPEC